MDNILIKDIMTSSPISININSNFSTVEEILRVRHIRHLPVVDDKNVLQGIITQRDLYRLHSPKKTMEGDIVYEKAELDDFILKYVMTKEPLTLNPDETLAKAIKLMVVTKYGCIPIVDKEKKLIGIITQIDILKAIYKYSIAKENKDI